MSRRSYVRRLIAGGVLHQHGGSAGFPALAGYGLDLLERVGGLLLDTAAGVWPLTRLEHVPYSHHAEAAALARSMSDEYDFFEEPYTRMRLTFDPNLAHLSVLRELGDAGARVAAVGSILELYRPTVDCSPLFRDSRIWPTLAIHVISDEPQERVWDEIVSVLRSFAHRLCLPAIIVKLRPPTHYAKRLVAGLLPAHTGVLEPWCLSYELHEEFRSAASMARSAVYEIGVSGRVIALAAHCQSFEAYVPASAVAPTHFAVASEIEHLVQSDRKRIDVFSRRGFPITHRNALFAVRLGKRGDVICATSRAAHRSGQPVKLIFPSQLLNVHDRELHAHAVSVISELCAALPPRKVTGSVDTEVLACEVEYERVRVRSLLP